MKANTRLDGIIVPPLSKIRIHEITDVIRSGLQLSEPYLPIMQMYEMLDFICDDASFEVLYMHQMGSDHGRTKPDENKIYIREDVYEGANNGSPRDRFTMCHELGHLVLHKGVSLSRIDPTSPPPIYKNSEWQADMFASCLMMPKYLLRNYSDVSSVMQVFGVSKQAANARRRDFKMDLYDDDYN